jgi:two-component system, cell cycle sensor histidine kinase and response regulator CckA
MTQQSVLVVEDNPITRKMMVYTLSIEGYAVLEAGTGRAALALAGRRPDLFLIDYVLPDMDGLQLLATLRSRPGGTDVPAAVITGMVSHLEEMQSSVLGPTRFLPKPIEPERLLEFVRGHLDERSSVVGAGKRVLVVDDEMMSRKLTAMYLEEAGFQVETADSGADALEKARLSPPDAILSDVMMPGMDGFLLSRAVRSDARLTSVPVVLLSSAYVEAPDQKLAHDMGANTLLPRGGDMEPAIQALADAMRTGVTPDMATGADLSAAHTDRVRSQLEKQMARNETLLRQSAIQAAALSVVRGLAEALARPDDLPAMLADVLVHCLDAAGLSSGVLYLPLSDGQLRLQAQAGLAGAAREDALTSFGHPEVLRDVLSNGQPAAYRSGDPGASAEVRDFVARIGQGWALVVPFVVRERHLGAMILASDSQDLSNASWTGFARSLGMQFGQTIALGQYLSKGAATELRYRALMAGANDAIVILDSALQIVEANHAAAELFGLAGNGGLVGRAYLDLLAPEERETAVRKPEGILEQGVARIEERQMLRADGTRVVVDISFSLVRFGEEDVMIAVLRDITDRKRAERDIEQRMELAAFAADVGVALVRNDPLPVALQHCAEAMMRHLEPAFARIWTLDATGDTLELQASAGMYTHLDGAHERVPLGKFEIGLIAAEREPHLTNDVQHDAHVSDPEWARREGMVAFAGYPLVVGDRLVGVMAMFARHSLSTTVLDAMASVANQIALGIERTRTEEALREAQQRLQHVVSSSPTVLYTLAVEGQTLTPRWVSANVERFSGYTPEEVRSADWWEERLHPDDRERVMAQVPPLLSEGSVVREYRFRHRDGAYRWIRDEQILIARPGEADEVVGSWSDVTAQKDAELRLHESEEQYRLLFDNNPYPMWVFDVESLAFLAVNDAAVRHYGWTREEFLRMRLTDIRPPETLAAFMEDVAAVRDEPGGHDRPGLWRHRKKDGTEIDVEVVARSIVFQGRRARLTLAADVTEKTLLQAQLVRAQKMEAVGQLAGGVAHDFNNLLGVITGYSELLMRELPAGSRERKRAEEVKRASDRAAALTRQLLAFSRRQVLQPKVLDLNEVVAEVEKMMRRLISESIQIVTIAAARLGKVRADAGQIEQVLMNLAINARDAMPSGGRLVIETGNIELDETYVRTSPEARPGPYVMLAVSDTGHGMDAKTMARIFEPFFTTKEEGKGTGLGLATVYGIVRQSGGTVNVYSEPGRGTTFRVYLPRIEGDVTAEARADVVAPPRGTETVLLVEDAEALRLLVRELLENAGYTVLDADSPDKALSMVESVRDPIHLLLTDMVMPRMNGQELARRIAVLKPEARVVFMSGYSDQAMGDQSTLEPGALFLQKPFTMDALLKTIRRALDAAPGIDGGSGE